MNDLLEPLFDSRSSPEGQAAPAAVIDSERVTERDAEPEASLDVKKPLVRWRKLLALAAVYVTTETALDLAGLDTLANYSEFLQNGQAALQIVGDTIVNLAHLIS